MFSYCKRFVSGSLPGCELVLEVRKRLTQGQVFQDLCFSLVHLVFAYGHSYFRVVSNDRSCLDLPPIYGSLVLATRPFPRLLAWEGACCLARTGQA